MPRPFTLSALLTLVALSLPCSAYADGMRCGTKLVSNGDSLYEVHSRCGEPAFKTHRMELRTVRRWVSTACAPNATRCGRMVEYTAEVQVDEWTYDFGPTQFVRTVVFEDGRLFRVLTGDYGSA